MSWIDPLRRLIRPVQERHVEPKPEEPAPAPLEFGLLEQSARIMRRAHLYRQQIQRAAEAQAREQEAREQREREARQLAWEDSVARALAARWVHSPGDDIEPRDPGSPQLLSVDEWRRSNLVDIYERRP